MTAEVVQLNPPQAVQPDQIIETGLAGINIDRLSLGQPWDEAVVLRQVLMHTETIVQSAAEVGRLLLWSKATLQGTFQTWCDANLPFSTRTAYNYMQVSRFFLDHPSLMEPLSKVGLKKALLIAAMPRDQVEQVVADGQVAEVPLSELEAIPYPELKKRLAQAEKARNEAEADVSSLRESLEETKKDRDETLATVGLLRSGSQKEALKKIKEWQEEFDGVMAKIGFGLDQLATRTTAGELDISVRLRIRGFAAYMAAYTDAEDVRFRCLSGEDVTGAEMSEPWRGDRPMSDEFELPRGRAIPFADDDN